MLPGPPPKQRTVVLAAREAGRLLAVAVVALNVARRARDDDRYVLGVRVGGAVRGDGRSVDHAGDGVVGHVPAR